MRTTRISALLLPVALLGTSATPAELGAQVTRGPSAPPPTLSQSHSGPVAWFPFDGTVENAIDVGPGKFRGGEPSFGDGLRGGALWVGPEDPTAILSLNSDDLALDKSDDFSVQFWVRTVSDPGRKFVVLSNKAFVDNSLESQKEPGWVFYVSGGTWAWNMGSGERRITYERANGKHMPLNDGRWHQLTMTYSRALSEIRLFYDGDNRVSYHVDDAEGFDFSSHQPLTVGWDPAVDPEGEFLPAIEAGAEQLQELVDAFNRFGLEELEADDFPHLIVDPRRLFEEKVGEMARGRGADSLAFREEMEMVNWEPIRELESALMDNPYTVHQVLNFMETAPLLEVYSLVDGEVTIRREGAVAFAEKERLLTPDFEMDDLAVWDRVLLPHEVLESFSEHFKPVVPALEEELPSLTAAVWNIWHGGKHFTVGEHGWDSRVTIAEILKREGADIIMMQETYSSGDFIAAELGYYFATTVDWDYLNQGSNISVLSRYPIRELHVQEDSPFMNVSVKIAISESQELYAMSNWYGMDQFPAVFEFHQARFGESDFIPTLFAGDFNAVPHTDGGESPASRAMLDAGFTDAFRSLNPNVEEHPGPTHRSGRRIDQLYYKGVGLRNTSTRIISTWPTGFPSDHFLILSTFDLDYSTPAAKR